jgi:hypothetical protein
MIKLIDLIESTVELPYDVLDSLTEELQNYMVMQTYIAFWRSMLRYFDYERVQDGYYTVYYPKDERDVVKMVGVNEYIPTHEAWSKMMIKFAKEADDFFFKSIGKPIRSFWNGQHREFSAYLTTAEKLKERYEIALKDDAVNDFSIVINEKNYPELKRIKNSNVKEIIVRVKFQNKDHGDPDKMDYHSKIGYVGAWARPVYDWSVESARSILTMGFEDEYFDKLGSVGDSRDLDELSEFKFNGTPEFAHKLKIDFSKKFNEEVSTLQHELTHVVQIGKHGVNTNLKKMNYFQFPNGSEESLKAHKLDRDEYKARLHDLIDKFSNGNFTIKNNRDVKEFIKYDSWLSTLKKENPKVWEQAVRDFLNTLQKKYGISFTKYKSIKDFPMDALKDKYKITDEYLESLSGKEFDKLYDLLTMARRKGHEFITEDYTSLKEFVDSDPWFNELKKSDLYSYKVAINRMYEDIIDNGFVFDKDLNVNN